MLSQQKKIFFTSLSYSKLTYENLWLSKTTDLRPLKSMWVKGCPTFPIGYEKYTGIVGTFYTASKWILGEPVN